MKEATARLKIQALLEDAGWRFFDSPDGKANVCLEANVKLRVSQMSEWGDDFEQTKNGYVDFLLLDEHHFPLVVVEAKRSKKHPLDGKAQARAYARAAMPVSRFFRDDDMMLLMPRTWQESDFLWNYAN